MKARRGKRSNAIFADHDADIIGSTSRASRSPYDSRSPERTASAASLELSSAS
jgi:hypothetical protein